MNIDKQYDKINKILNNWKKRNLTMIGRITVIKSLIIPNITYIASVTDINKGHLKPFKSLIYKYIWDGKSEKIQRNTLSLNLKDGGMNMTDIDSYIDAIKLSWIKRLTLSEDSRWKIIPKFYLSKLGKNFLIFKMNLDKISSIKFLLN